MKEYKFYINDNGMVKIVKSGWSWPAFCFTWIWALTKELWSCAILLLVLGFIVGFIRGAGSDIQIVRGLTACFFIGAHIVLGVIGNDLFEKNLIKKGFKFDKKVMAENIEKANNLYQETK